MICTRMTQFYVTFSVQALGETNQFSAGQVQSDRNYVHLVRIVWLDLLTLGLRPMQRAGVCVKEGNP